MGCLIVEFFPIVLGTDVKKMIEEDNLGDTNFI